MHVKMDKWFGVAESNVKGLLSGPHVYQTTCYYFTRQQQGENIDRWSSAQILRDLEVVLCFALNVALLKWSVPGGVLREGDRHASETPIVLSSLMSKHLAPITDPIKANYSSLHSIRKACLNMITTTERWLQ